MDGAEGTILVFETPEQVALAAAEKFAAYTQSAIAGHGKFSVALAGGTTPRRVYELLASHPFKNILEWSRVHLFFGDERCVPPDHPDSNYGMVNSALITKIPITSEKVHRMQGEGNPEDNAAAYEDDLRTYFGAVAWPRFDLVLLGLGQDGHTASLFPGSDAVNEQLRWVVATRMEQLNQDRITLTMPVLNQAAHVMFLVTGQAKASPLFQVVSSRRDTDRETDLRPAQLIHPADGTLEWLVDKQATARLAEANHLGA